MKIAFQNNKFPVEDTLRIYNHFMYLKEEGLDIVSCPNVNTFFLPEQNSFFSNIWKIVESPTIAYCNSLLFFRKRNFSENDLHKLIFNIISALYTDGFSLNLYDKGNGNIQVCVNNISFTSCFYLQNEDIFSCCLVVPHRVYDIFNKDIQEHFSSEEIAEKIKEKFKNGN